MKLVLLQFEPSFCQIEKSMNTANKLLSRISTVDYLILPEMCFTGYNFKSREEILPFCETDTGPTIKWAIDTARRFNCIVQVGYPRNNTNLYNSICVVNKDGIITQYDKHFLYTTDESWATEGESFKHVNLLNSKVGFGICMDFNPYQFKAPFTDFEFANYHLTNECDYVFCSMAWLLHEYNERSLEEMIQYWALRLSPLVKSRKPVVVAICNRVGREGETKFGGASTVLKIEDGKFKLLGYLDTEETNILQVQV
ncbi:Carbon-nitrogen hydrolase [Boothiomyces sp. JEL0838]|nr:Carbon-nitrogen hydrolase [Boothiomyces sp. JEL0838]